MMAVIVLNKFLAILLSLGILFHAFWARKITDSWSAPGVIFSLFWFLLTFIPLILVLNAPVNPIAIFYILLCCVAFSATNGMVKRSVKINAYERVGAHSPSYDRSGSFVQKTSVYQTNFLNSSFFALAIISLFSFAANAATQGISINGLMTNFFRESGQIIENRYTNNLVSNVYAQISTVSTYLTVIIGGIIISNYKSLYSKILIVVLSILPSALVMSIFGAKGMIFLCVSLFIGGTSLRKLDEKNTNFINKKIVIYFISGAILILPILIIALLSRGISQNQSANNIIYDLMRFLLSYSSNHVYAFSDWFTWYTTGKSTQYYYPEQYQFGFYTFMSAFQAMGSEKYVPLGIYGEYFSYGSYLTGNIYTIYRGLIQDFSIFGSLIFIFTLGLIFNLSYINILTKKLSPLSSAIYVFMFGFIYMSYIISIFTFNSALAIIIFLYIIFTMNIFVYNIPVSKKSRGLA